MVQFSPTAAKVFRIASAYLAIIVPTMLWYFIETDGGQRPDAAPHRTAVYFAFFLILPLLFTAFFMHILSAVCSSQTFAACLIMGAISGFVGVFLLMLAIGTSSDGEAAMAYLAIVLAFCIFAVFGIVSTLFFRWFSSRRQHS